MSDAAVFALVSGLIQITVITTGFLTLWIKLKYGVEEAKESAEKAEASANVAEVSASNAERRSKVVEEKIDVNTKLTKVGVVAATKAASKSDEISDKLNGDTDTKIHTVVREYLDALIIEQNKTTKMILAALDELRRSK